jgi:hypothetical protein
MSIGAHVLVELIAIRIAKFKSTWKHLPGRVSWSVQFPGPCLNGESYPCLDPSGARRRTANAACTLIAPARDGELLGPGDLGAYYFFDPKEAYTAAQRSNYSQ